MARYLSLAAALLCLAGAAFYAKSVDASAAYVCSAQGSALGPAEVEKRFEDVVSLEKAGHGVEAILVLRERAEKGGALKGAAHYLLGEAAFREGAYPKAVESYIAALKADPSLSDRVSPFGASAVMAKRLKALKAGAWSSLPKASREAQNVSYLERRLAGGCK